MCRNFDGRLYLSGVSNSIDDIADEDEQNRLIDETMRNLFQSQLEDSIEHGVGDNGEMSSYLIGAVDEIKKPANPNIYITPKELVENEIDLCPNCPVEFVYKNRVMFGNYLSMKMPTVKRKRGSENEAPTDPLKQSNTAMIMLPSGKQLAIDIGQIISTWDVLADENDFGPFNSEMWAQSATEALDLLRNLSPRKSDLDEFWQLISRRSNTLPVDSQDLGIYIFQERMFRTWINPYSETSGAKIRALTSAERYASALLLHNDNIHFKRRQTTRIFIQEAEESDQDTDGSTYAEDLLEDRVQGSGLSTPCRIVEGGYSVLKETIASFKECEAFSEYFTARCAKQEKDKYETTDSPGDNGGDRTIRAACIPRQLAALELFALSPARLSPPKSVRALLRKLDHAESTAGAREVLQKMGHRSLGTRVTTTKDPASSKATPAGLEYVSNLTPWSPEVVQAAMKLQQDSEQRREELSNSQPGKIGKRGHTGKVDFRGSSEEHPVLSIDAKYATFLDDAFSLSPDTGELLVHVVDVVNLLRRHQLLQATSRDRISSHFLPSGPLHMLPPQALEALKLSQTGPNEAITVALSIDYDSGEVLGFRIFPSIIGPTFSVDLDTANEIIGGVGVADTDEEGAERSVRWGYPDNVVRDLRTTYRLVQRVLQKEPNLDNYSSEKGRESSTSDSNRIVNTLLTLYSKCCHRFCLERDVNVPMAWENRDRVDTSVPRRFATQPLRNWLAQLQQKQVRAALKLELPLSRSDCALAVAHHNSKRKQLASQAGKGRQQNSYDRFDSYCQTVLSAGEMDGLVLTAEGLGRGGVVRINTFNINGVVNSSVEKGQVVQVKVLKSNPETRTINLALVPQ